MASSSSSCCCFRCSRGLAMVLLLISAVPFAIIVALERTTYSSLSYEYRSHGWLRECAKWDDLHRRFLVSTFSDGGVAEIDVGGAEGVLEERTVVSDADVAGNASLGVVVDLARGRLMVVYADVATFRFGAVAAYDLESWDRLFLTQLSGPGDEQSFADDVAVDENGNTYITDCKANKIWKVGLNGELLSVIRSEVFTQRKEWYNFVGLNGIVHHPNGYLLVIHTTSGHLFKVDIVKEEVSVVRIVGGSLLMGDGLELLSPTKLVVAGTPSARVVESSDDWKTCILTGRYMGPMHRVATAATVKDGKVFLNHLFGGGFMKRTHVIVEAMFSPSSPK